MFISSITINYFFLIYLCCDGVLVYSVWGNGVCFLIYGISGNGCSALVYSI